MDSLDSFMQTRPPTARRPLLGLTVLIVEDSRFASEAMRLMCLRSGARIRRADSLQNAQRHLAVYRPSVVIVDIGLPDGSGVDLIRDLNMATPRVDVLLATSGDPDREHQSIRAGADGFLAKPMENIAYFQQAILKHLPLDRQPSGMRVLEGEEIAPDILALRDDLTAAAMALEDAENPDMLRYMSQFLSVLARSAKDAPLATEADKLAELQHLGDPVAPQVARVAEMVQDRIAQTAPV